MTENNRINIYEGLQRAAQIAKRDKSNASIPQALALALETCKNAHLLIPEETAPLKAKLSLVEPEFIPDIEYQIWLIEQQLTRASEEARRRIAHIASIRTSQDIAAELQRCFKDPDSTAYWFNNWAWTVDPREDASLSIIPFRLFPFQERYVQALDNAVFIDRTSLVTVKSRDVGVSWICCDWAVKNFLNPFKRTEGLFGSRKEELVDSVGEMDSLFEKMRFQMRMLPTWMLPEDFDWKRDINWCRFLNPQTSSTIGGESSNPDFGRGGRYSYILPDEYASFPYGGYEAWTAMVQSSRSKLTVSTPKGLLNKFADLAKGGKVPVVQLHWREHPWKTDVWYEMQKREMTDAEIFQELDCDFEASQPGQVFPQWKELTHIISADEFIDFYGEDAMDEKGDFRIPKEWALGMAMDVGYTDQHRWVVEWFAIPSEGYQLIDSCFLYRSWVVPVGFTTRQVAHKIFELEAPHREHLRMTMRLMSHEALGELFTLAQEHALSFSQWDTQQGYNFGIPQMQNYLEARKNYVHPFKEGIHGRPRFYVVTRHSSTRYSKETNKYEVQPAVKDCREHSFDCDHSLFRKEMPRYHFPESEKGKAAAIMRPFKAEDDSIDPARAVFAQFCPPVNPLEDSIKRAKTLPKNVQTGYIMEQQDPSYKTRLAMTREFIETSRLQDKEPEEDEWREQLRRG